MTAKRFNIEFDGHQYFLVIDEDNERCLARLDTKSDADAWLEMYKMLSEENKQLKQSNQELNDELQETMSYLALKSGIEKENEQLKSDLDYFQRTYEIEERGLDIVAPMCTIGSPTPSRLELFKENEQLKQFKENVFDLIDARTKAYEHKPFSARVSNPANPNYDEDVDRLARLSELQQLRKELKGDVE